MATFKKIGDFNISGVIKNFEIASTKLPILLSNTTENHFKSGFASGGGKTDASKTGWPQRQFTKGKGARNLLIKSGALQRDIQKIRADKNSIIVGTTSLTNKYAEIHNKGGRIRVTDKMKRYFWAQSINAKDEDEKKFFKNLALTKKAYITIPKREYIGKSTELENKLIQIIDKEVGGCFK